VISRILPPAVSSAETFGDIAGATLFPAEEAAMAAAEGSRRAEFATARACARAALAGLGLPAAPILPGPSGEPRWPAGVTGSITHCTGYRACSVAPSSAVAALGIDAEPDLPLPRGVLDAVATAAERTWLAERMSAAPQVSWDRLLFSAKESVYKAWFSLTGLRLRFEDAAILADPASGRLTARLLMPGPPDERQSARLEGRWLAADGLVVTTIAIPALRPAR
jgi:enterobactin synthetase component D / holo-[acyl-carrier protein] synthase